MKAETLVVAKDDHTLSVLKRALNLLSVQALVVRECNAAGNMLAGRAFDTVIIDGTDVSGGPDLLRALRAFPHNASSLAVALVSNDGEAKAARYLGANFVLQKPLTVAETTRTLQTAHMLFNPKRRRHTRTNARLIARFNMYGIRSFEGTVFDVSDGGFAAQTVVDLGAGSTGKIEFSLPGCEDAIHAEARVVWSSGSGRAGFCFLDFAAHHREIMRRWLVDRRARPHFV